MSNILEEIKVSGPKRPEGTSLSQVQQVIAVASGKGGVGKSTTAIQLARTLSKIGAKVGLMDADIYGPSLPKILNLTDTPTQREGEKIKAPEIDGIKVMSMASLGGDNPVIWRGPMASRAITQFLSDVDWGELDYLIVDLPPGTGDVQITISQAARLSGAIIVMTPQQLAVDVAKRGLKMFEQVRVPIIGIVENMSTFHCEHCGEESSVFKSGGGEEVSRELDLPLLAQIPFHKALWAESDGKEKVNPLEGELGDLYKKLSLNMSKELRLIQDGKRVVPLKVLNAEPNVQNKMIKFSWSDGKQSLVTFKKLRYLCPCAVCVDEGTGKRKIKEEDVDPNIQPSKIQSVGNYAIKIEWSDSHDSGIFSFEYLRKL